MGLQVDIGLALPTWCTFAGVLCASYEAVLQFVTLWQTDMPLAVTGVIHLPI